MRQGCDAMTQRSVWGEGVEVGSPMQWVPGWGAGSPPAVILWVPRGAMTPKPTQRQKAAWVTWDLMGFPWRGLGWMETGKLTYWCICCPLADSCISGSSAVQPVPSCPRSLWCVLPMGRTWWEPQCEKRAWEQSQGLAWWPGLLQGLFVSVSRTFGI